MSRLPSAFNRLAASNLAAQCAQQIGLAAAPLIAVLALGSDVTGTGLLQLAQTLPFLLLSIPLGVLADRTSRRRLMAAGELARAACNVVIVLLVLNGGLTLWTLAVLAFVGTAGAVAYSVATPALIPALVAREDLARANGRIELVRSLALTGGPALAGLLVGATSAAPAYALAATLSVCAAGALWRLPEAPLASTHRNFSLELREGAIFAFTQPLLRPLLITSVIFNIGYFALQTVYVPYAARVLGLSASGIGTTLAAYGAGMLLSALLLPVFGRRLSPRVQLLVGPTGGVGAALAILATLAWPTPWLAGVSFFFVGIGSVLWTIAGTTLRQAVTPLAMLGRVSAINTMATYGARPLGAALATVVGAVGGEIACLIVAGALLIAQAIYLAASPVARLKALPGSAG
ncbi:MFS transporter [Chitinolyticbacter albus]|uniref:MFS transporter n=1 Tax=Chitinolyticbacter albus TaxID=2961951 RepID=UPI0021090F90|nr:MFS transporter [Chitinolyticbacter albus]